MQYIMQNEYCIFFSKVSYIIKIFPCSIKIVYIQFISCASKRAMFKCYTVKFYVPLVRSLTGFVSSEFSRQENFLITFDFAGKVFGQYLL